MAFGDELQRAMHAMNVNQLTLARKLKMTQSAISSWCTGAAEPRCETVFAIERALRVEPGTLSRHLGYLPARPARREHVTVEQAILEDTALDASAQSALLATYEAFTQPRLKVKARAKPRKSR